jgi:hypothetical protein
MLTLTFFTNESYPNIYTYFHLYYLFKYIGHNAFYYENNKLNNLPVWSLSNNISYDYSDYDIPRPSKLKSLKVRELLDLFLLVIVLLSILFGLFV